MIIEELTNAAVAKWQQPLTTKSKPKPAVTSVTKLANQEKIDVFCNHLADTVSKIPKRFADNQQWQQIIYKQFRDFETTLEPQSPRRLDYFLNHGYDQATADFIHQAQHFDPALQIENLFQAIRNVWIMNSLQILYNIDVKITPSIFAYSMMYPYSDNYLDDPQVTLADKMAFSHKFRQRLLGEAMTAANEREEKMERLLQLIADDYERSQYPRVYNSLLAIHAAQEKSFTQQHPATKDTLLIAMEKGGTSVLADAYLTKGELTADQAQFAFEYGAFLQLIDDLQDIDEDLADHHETIFTELENKACLDETVNRLHRFIDYFEKNYPGELTTVICDSSRMMLIEAIAHNAQRFSPAFLTQVEAQSPVTLIYLANLRHNVQQLFSPDDMERLLQVFAAH